MSHVPHEELVWRAALRTVDDDEHGRHLRACPTCADELARLVASTRTVETPPPPSGLWARISDAVAPRPVRRPRAIVAACVATALASAAVVGMTTWMLDSAAAGVDGPAIALQPVGDVEGEATAWVVERDGQRVLVVDAADASPPSNASLEVWMLDEEADGMMVHLGTLDGASTELPLPAEVDVEGFPILDVSLEPLDGDPAHSGTSVWRGDFS